MGTKDMFVSSLLAGGMAGTFVDIALYPLDTIKTRLQSKHGFVKSGGFSGIYKGILPVLVGSAPTAAAFFTSYESIKALAEPNVSKKYHTFLYMAAASASEMVACLIRVPVEVLKQRRQVSLTDRGNIAVRFLYRGYWSTVGRDVPFSLIQFPLWEYSKKVWSSKTQRDILPVESAVCGAISGGISAGCTTPLDVVKTRIMLANKTSSLAELKILNMFKIVYKEKGLSGLFAGISPRVLWITMGGFIFFGVYEQSKVVVAKLAKLSYHKEGIDIR